MRTVVSQMENVFGMIEQRRNSLQDVIENLQKPVEEEIPVVVAEETQKSAKR